MSQEVHRPAILIVDDEVEILKVLRKTLEENYTVITATRAKEALQKIDDSIQVVISDQRMPEMTGSEFLRIMREQYPNIVRIIMTGYSDMNALIDSVNFGEIYRYISKPWDLQILLLTIQLAVEKHQQNKLHQNLILENKVLSEKSHNLEAQIVQLMKELEQLKEKINHLH